LKDQGTTLLKPASEAGMKYYFFEQDEYAMNAFDSLKYDNDWLVQHWQV
jgi:hypothetical protein